eukprot:scaffold18651_cov70-Phaeocystis_antarctica.AAC.5
MRIIRVRAEHCQERPHGCISTDRARPRGERARWAGKRLQRAAGGPLAAASVDHQSVIRASSELRARGRPPAPR